MEHYGQDMGECGKWTTMVFIWRNVVNGALWSGYGGVW